MDRFLRTILIIAVLFGAWQLGPKLFGGGGGSTVAQPIGVGLTETAERKVGEGEPAKCTVDGPRYRAVFSARGAALVDYFTTGDPRYQDAKGQPIELMSVGGGAPERWALRFDYRAMGADGANAQVAWDVVDWKIVEQTGLACTFKYDDERVHLTKRFAALGRPYEMAVGGSVENAADEPRVHRLAVEQTAFRTTKEVESSLGRQSPFVTDVGCGPRGRAIERHAPGDFAPDKFKDAGFEKGWLRTLGPVDFAATSNAYFSQAIVPEFGPGEPDCALQIEDAWDRSRFPDKSKDDAAGAYYRARLLYPEKTLAKGEKAAYAVVAYVGPKDRDVLASAAGGGKRLSELIQLGSSWVAPISKILVKFLIGVHGVVGNWGVSIILLTLLVKALLFPLTWKQIQSTVAMRRLKPQIDEVNRKFADDAQQKQLAMMEVYRQNKVNPFAGCLPVLVQMPVWWALYATLQTAVELYHTPFLWFRDLSAPDPYFVLPVVIGVTFHLANRLMPQQPDPMQQKMMLWFMPVIFTVMMLFLPAGLGVYIFTNSMLGILQQQIVERISPAAPPDNGIRVKEAT